MASAIARPFSGGLGINGVVNGHDNGNNASPDAPKDQAGGWYSPDSVERRLRKTRSRPAGAPGRTTPPPSEEDFWLAAQAPGYTEDRSTASQQSKSLSGAAARLSAAAAAIADANVWAPLPVVRISTGKVTLGNLLAFIRTYELLCLPAYKSSEGCLDARLLIADLPAGVSRGSLAQSASGAGRGSIVTVQSVTRWANTSALETAQKQEAYVNAMKQLQTLFQEPPQPFSLNEVASFSGVSPTAAAAGAPSAAATASEDGDRQQPGPELGLR